jgi:uncharacterized protein
MIRAFKEIAFTDSVKKAQHYYGSPLAEPEFMDDAERGDTLTEAEIGFLAERDSFYISSTAENGWPYIQHRGGPKGFIKVLDEKTLGFADYRGNRQYISAGNMNADDRVALILMDYAQRQRLKIWARARIIHADEAPELMDKLATPEYRARIERGIILTIAALDWNCPQHIVQRYSKTEIEKLIAPLIAENRLLKAQLEDR